MTALDEAQLALSDRGRAAQDKARILQEALPWITHWAGRTVVVKVGGSVGRGTTAETMEQGFAADVALLRSVGLRVVVVHGGGPQISHLADRPGLPSPFADRGRATGAGHAGDDGDVEGHAGAPSSWVARGGPEYPTRSRSAPWSCS